MHDDKDVMIASFPDLTEVAAGRVAAVEAPVDERNFSELMHRADHRDEIGAVLVRYAASLYDRACLFSVHKQTISGWLARGRSVVLEDLQSFSVPEDDSSLFADVGSNDSYVGAVLDTATNRMLVRALADPAPTDVVVIPIRVKQRTIAFLVCDNPGNPASGDSAKQVVMACRKAGVAFEALILRKKILS